MPNTPKTKSGTSLREKARIAARLTEQQQQQRANRQPREKTSRLSVSKSQKSALKETADKGMGKPGKTEKKTATKTPGKRPAKGERSDTPSQSKADGSSSRFGRLLGKLPSGRGRVVLIIVLAIVLVLAFLYPVGCSYYQAYRQEQRLQAELDAVNARNDAIQSENDALNTDEGIENAAREDLGWVKEGETATVVTNADDGSSSSGDMPEQVISSEIEPPHTWYYDILDVVFRVEY